MMMMLDPGIPGLFRIRTFVLSEYHVHGPSFQSLIQALKRIGDMRWQSAEHEMAMSR